MPVDLFSYLEREHGVAFNEQQKQGVLAARGNTLLLAVPGSGKTTVLVSRIANLLLNQGVSPERVLTITFSRETARDMKRRYLALFGSFGGQPPAFVTIHSFCLSVMKRYAQLMRRPMPRLMETLGEGAKIRLLREIHKKHTREYLAEDELENLDRAISRVKNTMAPPETEEEDGIPRFGAIFASYESYKRANRLIDFDDMLTLSLDIFIKLPAILSEYQDHFDYVNVDEAQDTSLIQHRIIELLSRRASVFMVGDEDQSIYSFRGACPGALLEFEKRYKNPSVIKMEENFRSGQEIVRRSDAFIRQNSQRYEKNMITHTERPGRVEVISLEDYAGQYRRTLELLRSLPAGQTAAVLYRNNESAIPMLDLFEREGIACSIREHRLSYFSSSVIRDVTAYILLAADPGDVASFGQIYYKLGYSRGVYDYVRERVREYDGVFDCILSIASLPSYRKGHTRRYREGFSALFRMKPPEAIDYLLSELGYGDYLENRVASGTARISAYQKLNTAKCIGRGLGSVYFFLDRLEELEKSIQAKKGIRRDAPITLSTLHSSKGMEFDMVILLDVMANILPSSEALDGKRMGERADYENEVRLFYVGTTRAKERLVLYRSHRMNGADAPPSPFLRDFLEGLREAPEEKAARPQR